MAYINSFSIAQKDDWDDEYHINVSFRAQFSTTSSTYQYLLEVYDEYRDRYWEKLRGSLDNTTIEGISFQVNNGSGAYRARLSIVPKNEGYDSSIEEKYFLFGVNTGTRPEYFEWDSVVETGADMTWAQTSSGYEVYPLTADEWNKFIYNLAEIIAYCNQSVTGLYELLVTPEDTMYYATFSKARSIISNLSPSIPVPARRWSGATITAAFVNGLKDSLNSIS